VEKSIIALPILPGCADFRSRSGWDIFNRNCLRPSRPVMLNSVEREILKRFKAEVTKVLGDRLDRVVLFGSRSRGDADLESDFDLLVTARTLQKTDRRRIFDIAADLSLAYGTVLAVLVVPSKDFTEDRYFYLHENIQREGQVV